MHKQILHCQRIHAKSRMCGATQLASMAAAWENTLGLIGDTPANKKLLWIHTTLREKQFLWSSWLDLLIIVSSTQINILSVKVVSLAWLFQLFVLFPFCLTWFFCLVVSPCNASLRCLPITWFALKKVRVSTSWSNLNNKTAKNSIETFFLWGW